MNDTRSQGSTSTSTGTWGQPGEYSGKSSYPPTRPQWKKKPVQQAVPDEWDNDDGDDDDNDDEAEEDSAKVWENANNKAPMPDLVISPASTGTSVVPPPPAAYQPTMRILKRPSPSPSASNSTASLPSQTRNTLAEREAQYQEARNRIFGTVGEGHGGVSDDGERSGREAGSSTVLRAPMGPSESEQEGGNTGGSNGAPPKGFRDRRNRDGKNQNSSSCSSIPPRT